MSDQHFNMEDCLFGKVDCGVLCEVMRSPDIECPFSMFFTEEEVKLDIRTENDETEIKQIMFMNIFIKSISYDKFSFSFNRIIFFMV